MRIKQATRYLLTKHFSHSNILEFSNNFLPTYLLRFWHITTLLILSYLIIIPFLHGLAQDACPTDTLQIGDSVEGTITTSCDDGLLEFSATAGDYVFLFLVSTDFDAYLQVLDNNNQILQQNNDGYRGTDSQIIFRAPYTGIYTARATSNNNQLGSYALWTHFSDCDNPTTSTLEYGQISSGPIHGECSNFVFFAGEASDSVQIDLTSTEFDAYLLLLSNDGDVLATNDDGGDGNNARIEFNLPYTGTYEIRMSSYEVEVLGSDDQTVGSYFLMLDTNSPDPTPFVTSTPACGLPTRLANNATGTVITSPSNRIRTALGITSAVIGDIPVNEIFEVLGTSECADGFTWVNVNYNGITGWTAEADTTTYYVEPLVETTPQRCALPSRLVANAMGQVIDDDPNTLREQASPSSRAILSIPPDGIFNVIAGPICTEGFQYWQVSYEGEVGWTAEYGPTNSYWLDIYVEPTATPETESVQCTTPTYAGALSNSQTYSEEINDDCGDTWDFNLEHPQDITLLLSSDDDTVNMTIVNPNTTVIFRGRLFEYETVPEHIGRYQVNITGNVGTSYTLDVTISELPIHEEPESPTRNLVVIVVSLVTLPLLSAIGTGVFVAMRAPKPPTFEGKKPTKELCVEHKKYRIKNKMEAEAQVTPQMLTFSEINVTLLNNERNQVIEKKVWSRSSHMCQQLNDVLRLYRFNPNDAGRIQENLSMVAQAISQRIREKTNGQSGFTLSIEFELEGSEFSFKVETYKCVKGYPQKVSEQEFSERYKKKIALWSDRTVWLKDGLVWVYNQENWLTIPDEHYLATEFTRFINDNKHWFL